MTRRAPCPDEVAHASASLARLRWAIARSDRPHAELERAAGLAAGTIGHVVSGRRSGGRMGVWRAGRLAAALGVRVAWLVLGEGPAWWRVRLDDWCGECPICDEMTIGARCEAHGYLYRAEGGPGAVEIREMARRFTRLEEARLVAVEVSPARTVVAVRPAARAIGSRSDGGHHGARPSRATNGPCAWCGAWGGDAIHCDLDDLSEGVPGRHAWVGGDRAAWLEGLLAEANLALTVERAAHGRALAALGPPPVGEDGRVLGGEEACRAFRVEVGRLRARLGRVTPGAFVAAWAGMVARGYVYGREALAGVRLGWEMACREAHEGDDHG